MEVEIKHKEFGIPKCWIDIKQGSVIETLLGNGFYLTGDWR